MLIVLILDEVLASVDSENERFIGDAIDDLRQDKTIITIAYHLKTIQKAEPCFQSGGA